MERLSVSAGGAAEGSAGSPAGQPPAGVPGRGKRLSPQPLVPVASRASPEKATADGVRQDLVTSRNLRAPSARAACSANFQGLRAQALPPGYLLSRLQRVCETR